MRREDIPKDIEDLVLKEIYATTKYRNLAATYQHHKSKGNMMQARMAKKMMEDVENKVFEEFFKETYKSQVQMSEIVKDMTSEDQLTINSYANRIVLLADILDSIIVEMNELVKKYRPDMHVTSFDELNALSKKAKKTVYGFDRDARDEYATDLFSLTADNLFKMVINKSKSFVRKLNEYGKKSQNHKKDDGAAA